MVSDDDWAEKTQVGFVIQRRSDARVFRVQTRSSTYVLGFFGVGGDRPFAIMRGMSQSIGHDIDLRDSDPRVGAKPLFTTPPEQWVGSQIDMAGTTTSPVASAIEETQSVHADTLVRTLLQPAPSSTTPARRPEPAPPPKEEPKRREVPYPENCVDYVEALASMLRSLASNATALDDIGRHANLVARLKVALMNARVASDDVARRLG